MPQILPAAHEVLARMISLVDSPKNREELLFLGERGEPFGDLGEGGIRSDSGTFADSVLVQVGDTESSNLFFGENGSSIPLSGEQLIVSIESGASTATCK